MQVLDVCLVEAIGVMVWDRGSGFCWWTVVARWYFFGSVCVEICWRCAHCQNRIECVGS